jgi:hypothetical protein
VARCMEDVVPASASAGTPLGQGEGQVEGPADGGPARRDGRPAATLEGGFHEGVALLRVLPLSLFLLKRYPLRTLSNLRSASKGLTASGVPAGTPARPGPPLRAPRVLRTSRMAQRRHPLQSKSRGPKKQDPDATGSVRCATYLLLISSLAF